MLGMIEADSMDDLYAGLYNIVASNGMDYSPRGKACIELRPFVFQINMPQYGLYTGRSRRLNYRFLAIETLCYLSGISGNLHTQLILDANKNMAFAVNPETQLFDGAYGPALRQSMGVVIDTLKKDLYSRQAVASIWSYTTAKSHVAGDSKDVPCTCLLQFLVEKNRHGGSDMLSMNVYMRSNDLNWGSPYDVAAFCIIQTFVADILGLEYGYYNHMAGSLHFYEDGNSDGERPPTIADPSVERWIPELHLPSIANCDISSWDEIEDVTRDMCEHILLQRNAGVDWKDVELITSKVHGIQLMQKTFQDLIRFRHEKIEKP